MPSTLQPIDADKRSVEEIVGGSFDVSKYYPVPRHELKGPLLVSSELFRRDGDAAMEIVRAAARVKVPLWVATSPLITLNYRVYSSLPGHLEDLAPFIDFGHAMLVSHGDMRYRAKEPSAWVRNWVPFVVRDFLQQTAFMQVKLSSGAPAPEETLRSTHSDSRGNIVSAMNSALATRLGLPLFETQSKVAFGTFNLIFERVSDAFPSGVKAIFVVPWVHRANIVSTNPNPTVGDIQALEKFALASLKIELQDTLGVSDVMTLADLPYGGVFGEVTRVLQILGPNSRIPIVASPLPENDPFDIDAEVRKVMDEWYRFNFARVDALSEIASGEPEESKRLEVDILNPEIMRGGSSQRQDRWESYCAVVPLTDDAMLIPSFSSEFSQNASVRSRASQRAMNSYRAIGPQTMFRVHSSGFLKECAGGLACAAVRLPVPSSGCGTL